MVRSLPDASPLPMLDVYQPMMEGAAVIAAAELGLFAALSSGARAPAQLGIDLAVDVRAVGRLCDLLAEAGWLVRTEQGFGLSPRTARGFTAEGVVDYTAGLLWTAHAWELMRDLAGSVRRGGPERSLWSRMADRPGWGRCFADYMRAFARQCGPAIQRVVELPAAAGRLLDVGGSHGLHTMAFCERYPRLEATIFDLAVSLADTEAHLEAAGLQGRVRTRVGDARRDDLGGPYDAVLYFSVAHNQTPADNAAMFQKLGAALAPGGVLVVHDYVRGALPVAYGAAFDLTLLVETGTFTHDLASYQRWFGDAGLGVPSHVVLDPPELGSVLVGARGAWSSGAGAR